MTINFRWPLTNKPGDQAGGGAADKPAGEKPAGETPPAADKPAGDKPAGDKPAGEQPAGDKPAGDKPAGDGKPDGSKPGAEGDKPQPPEKYELKVPEGALLLETDIKTLEQMARKAGMTNDEAQAALDEQLAIVTAQSEAFKAAAIADADYGGEKLSESQRLANSVIERFRPAGHARRDGFLAFINRAGASNHPEVLGFLADIGRAMSEDSGIVGKPSGGGGAARKSDADVLFGDSPKS